MTRTARMTYSGTGYGAGFAKGQQADIGTGRLTRGARASSPPPPVSQRRPAHGRLRRTVGSLVAECRSSARAGTQERLPHTP